MTQQFKIDDIARVIRVGTAGAHMQGAEGRVVKVADGWVYVEDRTGQGLFNYGGVMSYMFQPHDLEMVSERLADWEKELLAEGRKFREGDHVEIVKGTYACTSSQIGMRGVVSYVDTTSVTVEVKGGANYMHRPEGLKLIETKQEEPEVKQGLKAGDKVRVINGSRWHKQGESGKIAAVDRWGNLELNGWWLSPQNVELVTEKPKARSQEIELEDVQVGDTVVAFWNLNGVEYRQKGTVAEINSDGEPITDEGNFVVHTGGASQAYSFGTLAEHIYLLERPEAKEPEIADGTYWARRNEDKRSKTVYRVEVSDGEAKWFLSNGLQTSGSYSLLVRAKNGGVSHLDFHTEDPTPEPTNLVKFEQAGNVVQKYKHCGMIYKLTKKGKVKVRSAGKGTSWCNSAHTVGSFLELVEFGDAVKI